MGSRVSILQRNDLALPPVPARRIILEFGNDFQIVLHYHAIIETFTGVGANLFAQPGILLNRSPDDLGQHIRVAFVIGNDGDKLLFLSHQARPQARSGDRYHNEL